MLDFDVDNYDDEKEVAARKQRTRFNYEEIKTLTTIEELEEYQQTLKNEGLYKKTDTDGGWERIITYECKETKRGCKYALIIRTSHENLKSTVSHRVCGHDHSNFKNSELSKEVKELITANSHLTAARIQKKMKVSFIQFYSSVHLNMDHFSGMPPNRHWSWNYYESFPNAPKIAKCFGCGQQYSNGSVSRMTKHLKNCENFDAETKSQILAKIEAEPLSTKATPYCREKSTGSNGDDDPEELCRTLEEVIKAATSMPENVNGSGDSGEFDFSGIPLFQTNNEHFLADTDTTYQTNQLLAKVFKSGYIASNFVENEDFKNFVHLLNPNYVLPSKTNLDKIIQESDG
uniref:BED-type domain-containing protein n=1 Tax=Panagrolaimus sp. ES5 TaxID=591445 RepID=A0AC34F4H6_9BILA